MPAVPGLTVTPVAGSYNKLDVSWNTVSGTAVYIVKWKTSDSSSYPTSNAKALYPSRDPNPTSHQITGLTAGTKYTVQVDARNTLGTMLARSETTATTNTSPPPGLVSNLGQADSGQSHDINTIDAAQAFTTGPNRSTSYVGWTLTGVDIELPRVGNAPPTYSVGIHHSRSDNTPGARIATLTNPDTLVVGVNSFTHPGFRLGKNDTYFIVVDSEGGGTGETYWLLTGKDSEDSGGAEGWSIGDSSLWRNQDSTGAWTEIATKDSLLLRINGREYFDIRGPQDDPDGYVPRQHEPADLNRVPRNVHISSTGEVTWDLDKRTKADPYTLYFVDWTSKEEPPAFMPESRYSHGFTSVPEDECSSSCSAQLEEEGDEFDPRMHYLVHVNTDYRDDSLCTPPVMARYAPSGTVEIINDGSKLLMLSKARLSLEEGGEGTYTVRLATEPGSKVTVNISVEGEDKVFINTESLTFTRKDWHAPQEVTVRGIDAGTAAITHSVSGGGDCYNGVSEKVAVTVSAAAQQEATSTSTPTPITTEPPSGGGGSSAPPSSGGGGGVAPPSGGSGGGGVPPPSSGEELIEPPEEEDQPVVEQSPDTEEPPAEEQESPVMEDQPVAEEPPPPSDSGGGCALSESGEGDTSGVFLAAFALFLAVSLGRHTARKSF